MTSWSGNKWRLMHCVALAILIRSIKLPQDALISSNQSVFIAEYDQAIIHRFYFYTNFIFSMFPPNLYTSLTRPPICNILRTTFSQIDRLLVPFLCWSVAEHQTNRQTSVYIDNEIAWREIWLKPRNNSALQVKPGGKTLNKNGMIYGIKGSQ